jgi:hypothetical protein
MMDIEVHESQPFPVAQEQSVQNIATLRGYTNIECTYITGDALGINGARYPIHAIAVSWKDSEENRSVRIFPVAKNDWRDSYIDTMSPYVISTPRGIATGNFDTGRPWNTGTPAGCVALADPKETCICLAQLSFDICARQANFTFAACMAVAIPAFVAAVLNAAFPCLAQSRCGHASVDLRWRGEESPHALLCTVIREKDAMKVLKLPWVAAAFWFCT